ncbi:DUF6502 family protein [Myxococcota bacterium]|nr:DUF6502 family protein [Myxococcota bacterium]
MAESGNTPGSDTTASGLAGGGAPPPALVRALVRVLRPLIRLLLSYQITYPYLANLLKSVYVDLAEREFAIPGKGQTISRTSLLTGIHRKDVKRLRDEPLEPDAPPAVVTLGAQLVARWMGVDEFLDGDGRPRPLPRLSGDGEEAPASFEHLVESVSKDIRARAVLDEWLRLGVVHVDGEDRVCLNTEAFVPESGFEEKAFYFGRNLHDHVGTAAHNLLERGDPMLERSVYYDRLSTDSVDELNELARRLGVEALQTVNRRALELQQRDAESSQQDKRMSFGVYFHHADDEPDEGADGDA